MRRTKTAVIIALLLISPLPLIKKTEASLGQAKVYIICLSDVPTNDSWVDNPQTVKNGAINACVLQGQYIEGNLPRAHPSSDADYPPYYEATPYVVTSWSQYESIITSYSGVIVVNTHGQYLPIPSSYENNKTGWVDQIADAMLYRRVTWVQVGGYPFSLIKYQGGGVETWDDDGFKHLMAHINKDDVNLSSSPYSEYDNATMLLGDQQIGLNWYDGNEMPITYYHYATLGCALKKDNFKDYLILPIFEFADRWTGAVIAFAKAGARYTTGCGCGAYVHIGARYLYTIQGRPLDADYGRGFIGTAAALWAECMGFAGRIDAKSEGSIWGPTSENTSLVVHSAISGVYLSGTDLMVTVEFAIYGVTQSYEADGLPFQDAHFFIDEVSGSTWSDVTMRVDLGFSREGYADGLLLSGLYDENHAAYGLLPSGIMWILGAPTLLAGYPIAQAILWGIGGVKLLAQYLQQCSTDNYSGVNTFADYIEFKYLPKQTYKTLGNKIYYEFMTLTTVELKIPTSGKSGWLKLPLKYNIQALPSWYNSADWLNATETLDLAIWFSGAGQSDAGSRRDANRSNPVSVNLPGSYHGYLDGSADSEDWYNFTVPSGKPIVISMTPPPFVDFDLELHRPDGSLKAVSHQGAGITDTVQCMTDAAGAWKIRIYKVQGSGVYSFSLEWGQSLTIDTRITPTGSRLYNVKVWINGVQYYSPVTISATAGTTYNVQVEFTVTRAWTTYVFDHWNDGSTSNSTTLNFPSTGNVTLTAYYGNACPTLFVWNGSEYVYETVLNIHAESDVTVQREIQQKLAPDGTLYKLELRELDNFTSHIDQVRLYAVDSGGEWQVCPLKYADYNGTLVTKTLLLDDNKRVNLVPSESIGLRFQQSVPYSKIAYFVFEINGYNKKLPP